MTDRVDQILDQWRAERPDLDLSGMAIIGRVSRLERSLRPRLEEVFGRHGLESWEFDVLATLRRSGPPFRLTAGSLLDSMMISSGTVTHRINRLEERGLIRREADPDDGRIVLVALTDAGRELVDAAVADHTVNEARLVGGLTETEQRRLVALLRKLATSFADATPGC